METELTQTIEETQFRNLVMIFLNETSAYVKQILTNQAKIISLLEMLKLKYYQVVTEQLEQLIIDISADHENRYIYRKYRDNENYNKLYDNY
jgi:hypothetical protein